MDSSDWEALLNDLAPEEERAPYQAASATERSKAREIHDWAKGYGASYIYLCVVDIERRMVVKQVLVEYLYFSDLSIAITDMSCGKTHHTEDMSRLWQLVEWIEQEHCQDDNLGTWYKFGPDASVAKDWPVLITTEEKALDSWFEYNLHRAPRVSEVRARKRTKSVEVDIDDNELAEILEEL